MKVYIGPYKKWWGPYQIADLVPFTSEEQKDKIGDFLFNTWLTKVCDWFNDIAGERDIRVRIDKYDTWNMDNTLALIALPMLKRLLETKNGSPPVDDEDLPPHMRYGNPDGDDNWIHYRWEWIIKEMIFSFENLVDDSWQNKYYHGEPIYVFKPIDDTFKEVVQTNPEYHFDAVGYKAYNERISNGFRLFGKYYRSLWD